MSKRSSLWDERSKSYYAVKGKSVSDQDQPVNPWAQNRPEDERFWHGTRIRISTDWLTVLILLIGGAALIALVMLMK